MEQLIERILSYLNDFQNDIVFQNINEGNEQIEGLKEFFEVERNKR